MFTPDDLCSLRWNSVASCTEIIDQTLLPHELRWRQLRSLQDYCQAISTMQVRGAPLIGITAAFGLACALEQDASNTYLESATAALLATRPTAVNLAWALRSIGALVTPLAPAQRAAVALAGAMELRQQDIANCAKIGEHGLGLLQAFDRGQGINVMTHCNAGWLATISWGTALAPIYKAHAAGIDVHVWVSETRPRNQGMNLTAWELERAGVPCTLVTDNACGRLLYQGEVDCVIVGSDRTAANGDVCNKIGTYLKALAARANEVPFYVALPESTIDWSSIDGASIPIEDRHSAELLLITGRDASGELREVELAGPGSRAHNPAFDVTPAALVDALVTERGVFPASPAGLEELRAQIFSSKPI